MLLQAQPGAVEGEKAALSAHGVMLTQLWREAQYHELFVATPFAFPLLSRRCAFFIIVVVVIYYSLSAPVLLRDMERLGWYSAWLQ